MSATPDSTGENSLYSRLVGWLSKPKAYPDRPTAVQLIETHISCVFLTDRFAYKLKKPVRFDFLDFSTVELRRQACAEEIRLNRRLAQDVYLGLVAVRHRDDDQFAFEESAADASDGSESAVDWLVKMQRLDEKETLAAHIQAGRATDEDADAIARLMADFYRRARPLPLEPPAYRDEILRHVIGNRTELSRAAAGVIVARIKRIHGAQLRLLHLKPELFHARVEAGRVVDGHGDLRPEHIYLPPREDGSRQPLAIDCIEFNPEFRHLDIADEMGFLATECDFAGAEPLGRRIFERTLAALDDHPPAELVAFYRSYRACVRAKVAVLRGAQLEGEWRAAALAEANRHLSWADRYDRDLPPPMLIVISGLMGTGKSTLAGALASMLGVELLSTDDIRRWLFGASEQPAGYGSGHYSEEDRNRVYAEMFLRAEERLDEGQSVILDGAFPSQKWRDEAMEVARRRKLPWHIIHCHCTDDVARQRITARLAAGANASEARPELCDQQKAEDEPWLADAGVIEIDTQLPLAEQVNGVLHAFAGR